MIIHELTDEELQFRRKLQEKQHTYLAAQSEYLQLLRKCKHVIVPRNLNIDEELKTDIWASTSAICSICRADFGWWCPKSPDHRCHYTKSYDDCDYCHMPEERK